MTAQLYSRVRTFIPGKTQQTKKSDMGFEFSLTGNVNNCNNGILITMNVFHVKNTNKHEILYKNGPLNLQLNKKVKI